MRLTKAEQARVDKAMVGEYISNPSPAEKSEIERRWFAAGRSNRELGRLQGWNRKTEPVMFKQPKEIASRPVEPYSPLIDTLPGEWVNQAACATSLHKDAWHPSTDDGRDAKAESQYAKAVCGLCPVKTECLTWALEVGPTLAGGVLGGVSEDKRRDIWRARKDAA